MCHFYVLHLHCKFAKDYETVTSRLLNEPVSYEESLENGIQKILDSKVFDFSYPELSEFLGRL